MYIFKYRNAEKFSSAKMSYFLEGVVDHSGPLPPKYYKSHKLYTLMSYIEPDNDSRLQLRPVSLN